MAKRPSAALVTLALAAVMPLRADPAHSAAATNTPAVPPSSPSTNAADETADDDSPVTKILATKKCDQVEISPDKSWLAATRTYSGPDRGSIWEDSDANTCLVIRDMDGDSLGQGFIYWQDPSLRIVRIGWSPDSRFLVVACSLTDGNQPWAFPTFVIDMKDNTMHGTDPLGTVVSKEIKFIASGALRLSTGQPSSPMPFDFDLAKHIGDLPVVLKLLPERAL